MPLRECLGPYRRAREASPNGCLRAKSERWPCRSECIPDDCHRWTGDRQKARMTRTRYTKREYKLETPERSTDHVQKQCVHQRAYIQMRGGRTTAKHGRRNVQTQRCLHRGSDAVVDGTRQLRHDCFRPKPVKGAVGLDAKRRDIRGARLALELLLQQRR